MAYVLQPVCKLRALSRSFWRDTSGATAIEYALIASLVAMVIIGTVTALGTSLTSKYENTAAAMQ